MPSPLPPFVTAHRSAAGTALFAFGALALASAPAQQHAPAFRERQQRREAVKDAKLLAAIQRGVTWLRTHQDDDGRFSAKDFAKHDPEGARCTGEGNSTYDAGVTGLALLAMLAQADATLDDACHRAADWLAHQSDPDTGRIAGAAHDSIYNHAIATLALCDAVAMFGGARHRDAATRAIGYLELHRNPGAAWRYQPHDNDNDTSISSWCLAAYASAHDLDIDVPARSVGEALAWFDAATDFPLGATGYFAPLQNSARLPGNHPRRFPPELGEALAAAGLHTRLTWGLPPTDPFAQASLARLASTPPTWDEPAIDFYYWLHGSIACALLPPSADQRRWQQALHQALLPHQARDGAAAGSWDPVGAWCNYGGRVYSTAMAVLALANGFRCARPQGAAAAADPALRRAHEALQAGKVGAAAAALADVDARTLTAPDAAAHRQLDFTLRVEVERAKRVLESLDLRWRELLPRMERLDAIATTMAGLPLATIAAERLAKLDQDPRARAEFALGKELAALYPSYFQALGARNKTARKRLAEQLARFLGAHPTTYVADRARTMLRDVE